MNSLTARFRVPWWASLLAAAGIALFVTAGIWQLHRATFKRELLAAFARNDPATTRSALPGDQAAAGQRYGRLDLTGHYDAGRQVLLDNMSHNGQPGYEVLTPFVTGSGVVLVNRGWLPADGNRAILPDVSVGTGERRVTGRIELLPRPGLALAPDVVSPDAAWPRRLLFPTAAEMARQSGHPLKDYQLLLDAGEADGYLRDWQPGGMGPERHMAYAVQWFGLALTVVVIYVVLGFRRGQ